MVYGLVGILVVIIAMLSIKIYLMERSAEEIMEAFGDRLESDTNILIDISSRDRKMRKLAARINAELRLLRKERRCYQQGNQELKDSVTNISHDLRTPLTAICGYLNLLKHEEKSAAVETYLVQIQSGVDVLRGLTEELFRYSIVTSSYELKREKINVVSVLEESLLSFYASMQEKGIQPVISMPEEPVWRMLDISALNRIFSNVIGNALKYSDGDLTVELKENGTIIFSNTAKTLNSVIVGRLFDRFCTVGTSYYATGLGLSIAKILTERMGGHIRAEYRDEKLFITVQFCISLP
ncbi:MAG: HAMP domain-containing histidine kinase [Lachnospiraceae bacterium]|nr:HAMP domain-containing histidine kinase [Lachnospiraceae bacterium]